MTCLLQAPVFPHHPADEKELMQSVERMVSRVDPCVQSRCSCYDSRAALVAPRTVCRRINPCCLSLETSQTGHGERHRFDPRLLQHFSKPGYRKLCVPKLRWARWSPLWQSQLFRAAFCKLHVLSQKAPHPSHPLPGQAAQQVCGVCVCRYVT